MSTLDRIRAHAAQLRARRDALVRAIEIARSLRTMAGTSEGQAIISQLRDWSDQTDESLRSDPLDPQQLGRLQGRSEAIRLFMQSLTANGLERMVAEAAQLDVSVRRAEDQVAQVSS